MERRLVIIEFTRSRKKLPLFSWLIQLVQRTKYSHVRIKWKAMREITVIYEASGSSLKFIGPMADEENPVEVVSSYKFNFSLEQYREMVKLCMKYANIEYGKKQIFGIGLVRAFGLKKNPFADGKKSQVCSEVIGTILEDILGWNTGLDLDIAGPREIQETIEKHRGNHEKQ